jgi:hypothetical protein
VPVSANPCSEISKRTEEVNFSKVWTKCLDEIKLRVGALPEHEIAQALLSRSSNDQVWVWLALRVEVFGDGLNTDGFRKILEGSARLFVFFNQPCHSLGDLLATAVSDGEIDVQA